jgi:hypothetical protein
VNPDTAETLAAQQRDAVAVPLESLRADAARMQAVRDSWRALWSSRLIVWAAGVGYVLLAGPGPLRHVFNPTGVTAGLGWLGDRLAAPAARWDAAWYLVIAQHGYSPQLGLATSARAAFFPLYPLLVGVVGSLGVPLVIAGVAVSVAALAAALYGLHRLTTLELGAATSFAPGEAARLAVLATALFPTAFFLSAVYSESIYLALSIGVFWCARQGRWSQACLLGAFAAATRSAGIVLVVPIALLYLYGPRADRRPDWPRVAAGRVAALLPRYRPRPDLLWLALVPAGLAAYLGYLKLSGGQATMPFHAQQVWHRDFAGPFLAVRDAAVAAAQGVRQLVTMQRHVAYFPTGGQDPLIAAQHNVLLFGFLLAAVPAVVGVFRRLPLAYGAYVIVALAMPLSYPVAAQPLMSLPRFEVVLFPLAIWAGAWLAERPRARAPLLGASALGLGVFVAQFATWHWVA